MSDKVWVRYDRVVARGGRADLYATSKGEFWFPHSQVGRTRELRGKDGPLPDVQISEWLAEKHGLV